MVNIAVFASGSGTNFETILSHIEDGSLHVNCACLIADKENAYARVRAHNHGVEEFYFNPKGYDGKAGYEAAILEVQISLSVIPPNAETTTITLSSIPSTIRLTLNMLLTEPTDVPPNFNTFIDMYLFS